MLPLPCIVILRPLWNFSRLYALCSVLSPVRLFVTSWIVARQALLSTGILQARILEWVAMPSSRGSSQPRNRTQVSHIAGGFFTQEFFGFFFFSCWLYRVSVVSGNWSKSWSVKLLTLFFSSLFLLLFAENSSMDKSIYFFKK